MSAFAAEQDYVIIARIRAAEVTLVDVSHGSLSVDMMQCEVYSAKNLY